MFSSSLGGVSAAIRKGWISAIFMIIIIITLKCQQPVKSGACRWVQTRSLLWMRAHLLYPGESIWSSGQQMQTENCYHLWVLFKYIQMRCSSTYKCERWSGNEEAPCPCSCWYDKKKEKKNDAPLPPTTIVDSQVCAGHAQVQKIASVQIACRMRVFVYLLYKSNHVTEFK